MVVKLAVKLTLDLNAHKMLMGCQRVHRHVEILSKHQIKIVTMEIKMDAELVVKLKLVTIVLVLLQFVLLHVEIQ